MKFFHTLLLAASSLSLFAQTPDAELSIPPVRELWNMADAERGRNENRDRICLNTLWQIRPAESASVSSVPNAAEYAYFFKVPGIWPGNNGWKKPGSSQLIYDASGKKADINGAKLNNVWYRRTIDIPAEWNGKKIELELSFIQTCGQVFIDGRKAGEFYFPGGSLDLSKHLQPGKRHDLAILVSAKVDDAESFSFNAPDRISKRAKSILCRGITGDVYLKAEPKGTRIGDVQLISSVKNKELLCNVGLTNIIPGTYTLETAIFDGDAKVLELTSAPFAASSNKRISYKTNWKNPKLWDTDTPENRYYAVVTLKNSAGKRIDTLYPQEFGFREFELVGRDFYLNGKRIHLSSSASQLPIAGAAAQTPEQYRKNAMLMKQFGQNHFIALNYNFSPGQTGYQDAFYVENSRNGILTTLTLPHPSSFEWKLDDPAVQKKYLELTGYLIRRYQNVPGLILYASTHNATGYSGDQNPAKIDGVHSPDSVMKRNSKTQYRQRRQAELAAELVKKMDPTRAVYHHESGNLGSMYTINCYLNWAPAQERSDWLEHWEKNGIKPLFLMEWGMPHVASWSSFRGPAFIWSADAVQCVWLNEFNAQYLGEEAYRFDYSKSNLMKAQEKLGTGNQKVNFNRYNWFGAFADTQKVWEILISENFRDLRARGLSGLLPWDQGAYWGAKKKEPSVLLENRFSNLKRTGISPDYSGRLADGFDSGMTVSGKAASKAFQPQLAWIAGKIGNFTSRNSYYLPGETVEKSIVILNDTRHTLTTDCVWSIPEWNVSGKGQAVTEPGGRSDLPVSFQIPASAAGKQGTLKAEFTYSNGAKGSDAFRLTVGKPKKTALKSNLSLYDPKGTAAELLRKLGVKYNPVDNAGQVNGGILMLGRDALAGCPFDLGKLASSGVTLLILEQPYDLLLNLGIRGNEHGFREVLALHPAFAGKPLSNWRGESTNLPSALTLPEYESQMPSWNWNGFYNKRVWRAGNRGTVSGVVPEKPSVGNWMPLLQAGFDLQYAPLLEFREKNARILFCQLDVSGRTEESPEALELLGSALEYLDSNPRINPRKTFYAGNAEGEKVLKNLKLNYTKLTNPEECGASDLLIAGPGASLASLKEKISAGLNVLALGLSGKEIDALLPGTVKTKMETGSYSDYVKNLSATSAFRGISNTDLHWRKGLDGAFFSKYGKGGKALEQKTIGKGEIVFCQVAPWMFDEKEYQYRTTLRRNYFLISRLAHNLGAESESGFPARLSKRSNQREGYLAMSANWIGKSDSGKIGKKKGWFKSAFKTDSSWRKVKVPGMFDLQFKDIEPLGWFWYRCTFHVKNVPANSDISIYLGAVDDESWVWLNGEFLGEVSVATHPKNFWAAERIYTVPGSKLKSEGNVLTVLCNNRQMNGGILGTPSLSYLPEFRLYTDAPESGDDPYRYYRW